MYNDPRSRNETFDTSNVAAYAQGYAARLTEAIASVNSAALAEAVALVEKVAESDAHIYAIGNGGSAAIADHLCCDWTKGTNVEHLHGISCVSLVSNVALYSAIANDFGFENVFSTQIHFYARQGDLLIAISSSGNSDNILRAVASAKTRGVKTIGLSGFDGGRLVKEADVALHVDANNYGIVEDAHQAMMHIMAQYITHRRSIRQS